ncbi:unnamed protein product [Heligmosomoides polygyrus]|uniref:DUF5681 domain-containing protein n=1 Tax=Heligmosomoides polygyrus TaxID=6339 RepID=A0A183GVC8_HELPZ|nr:unnamed protein product [Heligmosomoides polygyrus]
MSETLDQAKHDDVCMRQLAHLLKVDSTQVVLAVSQLLLKGTNADVFQAQQEQMSSANAQTADFRDAMMVQSGVAQPRIELLDFDPIAAAEGKPMVFKGAVRLTLAVKGSPRMRAAFYVMKGGGGITVIGTNILHNLGYRLQNTTRSTSPQISVESRSRTWNNVKESESKCTQTFDMRQECKVTANTVGTENILWSTDKLIADAIHTTTGATVQIPITNLSPETKVYKMGDVIGEWEKGPIKEKGQHPGYDISAYYAQAMARKEQISEFYKSYRKTPPVWGDSGLLPGTTGKAREEHWEQMRLVCLELVQTLTGPKRGFDARVIDHYGPLAESVPKFHPALSLGVSPRKGEDWLHGWQIMVFLEQLRDAASNTLRLPKFTLKPRKPKDDNDKDAKGPHYNDDAEPTAKKKKLPKRPDVMYLRNPKKKREEQAQR